MRRLALFFALVAALVGLISAGPAAAAVGDSATGAGAVQLNGVSFSFAATGGSGIGGLGATGTMSYREGTVLTIQATVQCLYVQGSRATLIGQITSSNAPPGAAAAVGNYTTFFVEDNGPLGVGQDTFVAFFGAHAPTNGCQNFSVGTVLSEGDIVVVQNPNTPAFVDVSPPAAVETVGGSHTVTATVTNVTGGAASGATVLFRVDGADSTSGSCTADANGQCSFTYQGPQLPGADLITACADANANGAADPPDPCGTATVAWLVPATTPGQVTGGGQAASAAGTDQVAFGFSAKSDSNGAIGQCNIVDPSTGARIKCLDVTALVHAGTHATLFGDATVNGVATTYRIDVDDLAEPGRGEDTFRIQTGSGYVAGGVLTNGNIQIR